MNYYRILISVQSLRRCSKRVTSQTAADDGRPAALTDMDHRRGQRRTTACPTRRGRCPTAGRTSSSSHGAAARPRHRACST